MLKFQYKLYLKAKILLTFKSQSTKIENDTQILGGKVWKQEKDIG